MTTIRLVDTNAETATLLRAAKKWWSMQRPLDWNLDKHLSNPTVNLVGDADKALGNAVAALIKKERECRAQARYFKERL